jgi:hypothetical protein
MALPSDVRKGFALPFELITDRGYALSGHSPKEIVWLFGGAEPPPHIGRRSRLSRRCKTICSY